MSRIAIATSRERFLQTLTFQPSDPPWVRWGVYLWSETEDLWRAQGWDGCPFRDVFGLDRLERVEPYYGPLPAFDCKVIDEDEHTITYIDRDGVVLREFKEYRDSSMPQFVRFPVENDEDFECLARERLALQPELRFPSEWKQRMESGQDTSPTAPPPAWASVRSDASAGTQDEEQWPRHCFPAGWAGYFGPLRSLMGLEGLCLALYDQPKLVERMIAERADAIIAITSELLKHTSVEVFWFWEDMAYKCGPLINPGLFRKLAFPHYRRVCDWLRAHGIEHIGLDSDGDIRRLIPLWLEAGINMLWPFEVAAGMDVVEVRQTYGHDLAIMGGIDKRAIALGGEAMLREVDRVMPLVEDGGYIPELDHWVPPDISWQGFCEYLSYMKHRLGRG